MKIIRIAVILMILGVAVSILSVNADEAFYIPNGVKFRYGETEILGNLTVENSSFELDWNNASFEDNPIDYRFPIVPTFPENLFGKSGFGQLIFDIRNQEKQRLFEEKDSHEESSRNKVIKNILSPEEINNFCSSLLTNNPEAPQCLLYADLILSSIAVGYLLGAYIPADENFRLFKIGGGLTYTRADTEVKLFVCDIENVVIREKRVSKDDCRRRQQLSSQVFSTGAVGIGGHVTLLEYVEDSIRWSLLSIDLVSIGNLFGNFNFKDRSTSFIGLIVIRDVEYISMTFHF